MDRQKFLVFSITSDGGLAEHIYYQSRTLSAMDMNVCLLAPKNFLVGRVKNFPVKYVLLSMPSASMPALFRRILYVLTLIFNYVILTFYLIRERPAVLLIDSYREYLSPVWAWPLSIGKILTGCTVVLNIHDPVRDNVIGPAWWHKWSVRLGYRFVDLGLIHAPVNASAEIPSHVTLVQVPVGIYDLAPSLSDRDQIRSAWNTTPEQKVFLCFGFIRNNKNIDLLIRALVSVPDAFLVIAGNSQSANDRPLSFYQQLAKQLDVDNRCHFIGGFIKDQEVSELFKGADYVALTYASTFHSQSGVLNLAAAAVLPVLASGADSPLTQAVRAYNLGLVISPDSTEAITDGMRALIDKCPEPDWNGYRLYAGWENNVNTMIKAVAKINVK